MQSILKHKDTDKLNECNIHEPNQKPPRHVKRRFLISKLKVWLLVRHVFERHRRDVVHCAAVVVAVEHIRRHIDHCIAG